jgi:hypothetical protein
MPVDEETARMKLEEIGFRSFVLVGRNREGDVQYLTSHTDHLEQLGFAEFVKLEIAKAGGI